jgi:hypothetical protein
MLRLRYGNGKLYTYGMKPEANVGTIMEISIYHFHVSYLNSRTNINFD